MLNDKQRNFIFYRLPECLLSPETEDAVKRLTSSETISPDDAYTLVKYIKSIHEMRWAERFGKYADMYAPNDLKNTLANLQDLLKNN